VTNVVTTTPNCHLRGLRGSDSSVQLKLANWKMAVKMEMAVVVSYQHGSTPLNGCVLGFRCLLMLTSCCFISNCRCFLFHMMYNGLVTRFLRAGRLVIGINSLIVTGHPSTATFGQPCFTGLTRCCHIYNLIGSSTKVSGFTAGTVIWFTLFIPNIAVLRAGIFVLILTIRRNCWVWLNSCQW